MAGGCWRQLSDPRPGKWAKLPDKIHIQLGAHALQNSICGFGRQGRLVGAPLYEGPEHIRNCYQADKIRQLAPCKPVGISRSVKIFVVMDHHVEHVRIESRNALQGLKSEQGMLPHCDYFLPLERAGLFQKGNRNSGFPDIVKQARERQPPLVGARKAELPAERHGNASYQQAMLIGQAVVMAHNVDPARKPLGLDVGDDSLTCRLNHIQINRNSGDRRSEDALQCPDPCRDPVGVVNRERRRIPRQETDVAKQGREQTLAVCWTIHEVSRPDGESLYGLKSNAMLDDENRFSGAWPMLQPKPEVEQARAVLQIDVDDGIFRRHRTRKAIAREGLRREDPRQLAANIFGPDDRVGDDRDSIHDPARNNSSGFTIRDLTN